MAIDYDDPEAMLMAHEKEQEEATEVEGTSNQPLIAQVLKKGQERILKNVKNLEKRVANSSFGEIDDEAANLRIGATSLADSQRNHGIVDVWSSPYWPPYDVNELAGDPCHCSHFWRQSIDVLDGRMTAPPDPSSRVPPHRHCQVCGKAAIEGDPVVQKLVRLHHITKAPDFHGWFCYEHIDETRKALPEPEWSGTLEGLFDESDGEDY